MYITSRRYILPSRKVEFAQRVWFHFWRRRLWPYREIQPGDILFWYETPSKRIVWKSWLSKVIRGSYQNKHEVKERLYREFGLQEINSPYLEQAPKQGYYLAFQAVPLQHLDLGKPPHIRFPAHGWLRITQEIAHEWLGAELSHLESDGLILLDDFEVEKGTRNIVERLYSLNEMMKGVSPQRIRAIVQHTIRKDSAIIRELKEKFEYRCQFPGCGVRIPKKGGGYYIEVAHIQPVSQGGKSILGNLLVLCPNHHKAFDYGDLKIIEQTPTKIKGILNGQEFEITLSIE